MKTLKLPSSTLYSYDSAGNRICTGSAMGRRNQIPDDYAGEKLRLQPVPFVDGCYDRWGAYWGTPANLWCAWGESATEQVLIFVRANDREEAKRFVLSHAPLATFYR